MEVARHRAALHRRELSRPIRAALDDGLLTSSTTFFDYGCGHGDDLRMLKSRGIAGTGWDPVHRPDVARTKADVVSLAYVVNVIEDPNERGRTLREAWDLARKVLVVAARVTYEAPHVPGDPFGDGYMTRLGTFQKFFEQQELASWLEAVLGAAPVPAQVGVFYVFRDVDAREAFMATRVRRAPTGARARPDTLFQQHQVVLQPLVDFLNLRGRLPDAAEIEDTSPIIERLGSYGRACAIVRKAVGEESLNAIQVIRSEDLLVYLALARFRRRPKFSGLPHVLQLDLRAFFRSYHRACDLADEVLMAAGKRDLIERACRLSSVGKLTPAALYLHTSALGAAPPLLRVYEGCASSYVGTVEGANVVKLHRGEPMVSYLTYPRFENDPHPALATSLVVPLQTFRLDVRDYRASQNPPVLHRKEVFVAADHPLREKFARLTAQEERAGLFEHPSRIGTRQGWEETLAAHGRALRGHRLVALPK